jgi:hypothetical protein
MRIDQPRIFGGMRDSNNQLGIANSVLISTGSEILWSSVNAAPGTIGGSIAANQVAYGSGSDAIQGSNNLTFDGTLFGLTGNLSVSGITTLQSTTIHLGVSSFASYIRDSRNQQGSPGQVLSATTTGVAWTTAGANYNNGFLNQPFSAVISTTVTHNFGSYPVVDVLDINNKVIVPEEITHNSVNDFIVVFETISTGVIIASNAAPVGIITGTVTGNLNATGFVTSVGFFGPGTNLTNLNASNLDTGTVPSARLTGTYSGITSLGVLTQLRVTGFVTSTGFFGPGTNLTNLNASNLDTGTVPSARLTGNYSGITSVGVLNQLQVTGFVTSTGFFGPGTNLTNLNASALDTGTVPSARLTGTYSGITAVGVLTQLQVTGFVTSTGFFGPGTNLTNLNASNLDTGTVPSARLTGNYSGITAVGTLSNLKVSAGGNEFSFSVSTSYFTLNTINLEFNSVGGGNVQFNSETFFNNNIYGSDAQFSNIQAADTIGAITGFFGPGTNLTNLNASNLDTGTVPSARLTGTYSGITSVGILTQLRVAGFITSAGFFGPGTNLTNLNASNLDTGTVPSARLTGTYSGITSLGVLTQLRVTGASTFTGQVFDSENRAGLAGSVLSSTGAGISWINPTSSLLTGIVSAAIGSTSILPTDTILQGIQKAQGHFNLFNTSVGAARYRNYTHDFDHNTRYFTSATDGSAIIDQIGLASHPGILTITIGTSTAFPQTRFAWGGPSGTYKPFMIDDFTRITWVFRYNLYASNEGWFGIYGISCFNSENQNNTICAFFNNTSLFLRAESSTGVITQINTGVTLTANAWYKMDLVRNSANSVSLIVNDSTMTTLSTTTMPFGTSCGVGGRMMTTQLTPSLATARSFDLDYLQMIFEPLGSRF